jgi:Ca2+-transporting ATPase
MTRAPRKINEPILSYEKIISSLIQGVIILSLVLVVYFLAIRAGESDGVVRALSFGALLVGNFFLTFANKSWKAGSITELLQANKVFMMVLVVVPIIFGLILYIPTLRELFYFI